MTVGADAVAVGFGLLCVCLFFLKLESALVGILDGAVYCDPLDALCVIARFIIAPLLCALLEPLFETSRLLSTSCFVGIAGSATPSKVETEFRPKETRLKFFILPFAVVAVIVIVVSLCSP
jgi:hypothetical protein